MSSDGELQIILKIGEKVNYNELSNGVQTNSSNLTTEDLEWRVLGVSEKGQLELISTKPTSGTVNLSKSNGWLNAVWRLDATCDKLYGKGKGASSARSLKVEDVNKLGNYTPTLTKWYRYKYDATANHLQYSISNDYNPENKVGTWTEYKNTTSETRTFQEPGKTSIDSYNTKDIAELQNTYYEYTVSSKIPSTLTTPDGILMSALITEGLDDTNTVVSGTNKIQWLSSRCVKCTSDYASFYVRTLNSKGSVSSCFLCNSTDVMSGDSKAVRPVVSLKSDVQLRKIMGIWTVSPQED